MPATSDNLEGGCACGTIRYRLTARPMFVHCCHCRDCQQQTGSAFVVNAIVETGNIEAHGPAPHRVPMPTASGKPHTVFRCSQCQSALWSEYGGLAGLRFVRGGTLDDPGAVTPDVHIYTRSKVPWLTLPGGVPAFEAYYRWKDVWPADALERGKRSLG